MCRPSGRNEGHRSVVLAFGRGVAVPPAALTRCSPVNVVDVNTMTLSRFHVAPPYRPGAGQSVVGAPPDASTRFRLPPAKNPSWRLSGDQNGKPAPSVPGRRRAVSALNGRTHSMFLDWD